MKRLDRREKDTFLFAYPVLLAVMVTLWLIRRQWDPFYTIFAALGLVLWIDSIVSLWRRKQKEKEPPQEEPKQ